MPGINDDRDVINKVFSMVPSSHGNVDVFVKTFRFFTAGRWRRAMELVLDEMIGKLGIGFGVLLKDVCFGRDGVQTGRFNATMRMEISNHPVPRDFFAPLGFVRVVRAKVQRIGKVKRGYEYEVHEDDDVFTHVAELPEKQRDCFLLISQYGREHPSWKKMQKVLGKKIHPVLRWISPSQADPHQFPRINMNVTSSRDEGLTRRDVERMALGLGLPSPVVVVDSILSRLEQFENDAVDMTDPRERFRIYERFRRYQLWELQERLSRDGLNGA